MRASDHALPVGDWIGAALALRAAGEDGMSSRVPTHIHPLAGRAIAWHVLRALAGIDSAARRLALIGAANIDPGIVGALPADAVSAVSPAEGWALLAQRVAEADGAVMVVDATAATVSGSLVRLACGSTGRALRGEAGAVLAVWLEAAELRQRLAGMGLERPDAGGSTPAPTDLAALANGLVPVVAETDDGFLIRDRSTLARASVIIRDRILRLHMEAGVTFLLPETVMVDVDVAIERDTVIYPGVVLEGGTSIGAETVVGPGCRIIDSSIGRGVELKGWNYISHTSIRNRMVLEPYVRRGFD